MVAGVVLVGPEMTTTVRADRVATKKTVNVRAGPRVTAGRAGMTVIVRAAGSRTMTGRVVRAVMMVIVRAGEIGRAHV